jgi:hypothetical protein
MGMRMDYEAVGKVLAQALVCLSEGGYTPFFFASHDNAKPCNPATPERPTYLSLRGSIVRAAKNTKEVTMVFTFMDNRGLMNGTVDPHTKERALTLLERGIYLAAREAENGTP